MNAKTTYALFYAFVGIAMQLIGFLLGLETNKIGTPLATIFPWVGAVIGFFVLWLGVRAVRDEKPDQCLTYGQGVGAGVIIVLIAALIGAVYAFVHFSFINPDAVEYKLPLIQQELAAKNIPDQQMEMMEKWTRFMHRPYIIAPLVFFISTLFGTVFSLIVAAIVKRNPPQGVAPVPPPL